VPLEVCGAVVKREFDYWQISEGYIKSCCWSNYRTYIENQRILNAFNDDVLEEKLPTEELNLEGWPYYRAKMWMILEYPRTSKAALVTADLFVNIKLRMIKKVVKALLK
jgi:hypothetical protein